LLARLKTSDVDPAQEGMDASQQVVRKLRRAGPKTRIIIRGDRGFSNNELMDFCETTPLVDYIFGQAQNSRLEKLIETEMAEAKAAFEETDETSKVYSEFQYQTRNS
jgi:tRNA(His) 5'-end guanylyltransferase